MSEKQPSDVLNEIIQGRRSVFPPAFSGKRIEDEFICQILENANWAPTHKMTEPWRFHVITDDSRTQLSELAGDWYQKNITGHAYSSKKHEKTMRNPMLSSHIIAICVQRDGQDRVPQWEEEAAVACAVQNLWLSASSLG
ncbi:MAG: nitroreductase, partial [Saprospiraceae bacterium]